MSISTCALREEGDVRTSSAKPNFLPFLSTPSARRATRIGWRSPPTAQFLSTPSARRATVRCGLLPPTRYDFYPRPPRGGRPCSCRRRVPPAGISIHALREEGDVAGRRGQLLHRISIHALREEGDRRRERRTTRSRDFYPRPPRGGRQYPRGKVCKGKVFLSTPSARRATRQ